MAHPNSFLCSFLCFLLAFTLLPLSRCQEEDSQASPTSTLKPPPRKYPVRMFIGNMYHRFRSNRTGYLLIPPLLRLAYQYGPNIIRGISGLASAGGQTASQTAVDSVVNSAVNSALGSSGQAAGLTGQAGLGSLGAASGASLGGQVLPAFGGVGGVGGGIPLQFGPPVFFRRRR